MKTEEKIKKAYKEFIKIISIINKNDNKLSAAEKLELQLTASSCLWVEEMMLKYKIIPGLSYIKNKLLEINITYKN